MARAARHLVVVFAALLALATALPVAAADPARTPTMRDQASDPSGEGGLTGVPACDLRLSVVDGPLVDANFSVRDWEPFIVWGFGYPAETTIFLDFSSPSHGTVSFDIISDSAGDFAGELQFVPGSDPSYPDTWSLTAEPVGGECVDGITISVEAPYPFTDVDGFENEIAWLYREGITGGCTATRFCPTNSVTRGQMAAFLDRALGLAPTATDFFDDDDGTSFEGNINRLAAAGITGGCATRRFCPDANVTREQMASFLARAFALPGASADYFGDDDASIHEGDINRLAESGITGGCAADRYCPRSNVNREQMAAFLYRALAP